MISSRSLMVNGQDKLVQGGEGEKGGGGGGEETRSSKMYGK